MAIGVMNEFLDPALPDIDKKTLKSYTVYRISDLMSSYYFAKKHESKTGVFGVIKSGGLPEI
jgi:hypothetical protein